MSWKPGMTLGDAEVEAIHAALAYFKGNKTHTAKALGVSLRTLRMKVANSERLVEFRRLPSDCWCNRAECKNVGRCLKLY